VIFVNRVDELSDPANQIPEIRASIIQTLADNNGPDKAQVLFGSAYWANMALGGDLSEIVDDSANALFNYAESVIGDSATDMDPFTMVWQLSGLPHLFDAISDRIAEGPGAEKLQAIRKSAQNHVGGLRASSSMVSMRLEGGNVDAMDETTLKAHLDAIDAKHIQKLNDGLDEVFAKFGRRIDQSNKRFLDRAVETLIQQWMLITSPSPHLLHRACLRLFRWVKPLRLICKHRGGKAGGNVAKGIALLPAISMS